jgi:hypothetical protein
MFMYGTEEQKVAALNEEFYPVMALQPFVGPWPLFQFLNLYTVSRNPWTGDQPVARPLPTHRSTQTQNKRTQTSMPRMGYEPTTPVLERTKTVDALDRPATVIGLTEEYNYMKKHQLISTLIIKNLKPTPPSGIQIQLVL